MTRIHIIVSEQTYEEFSATAEQYYSSNVSQLVRSAVRDHRKRTLEDEKQLTLQLIKSEMADLREIMQELRNNTEDDNPKDNAEQSKQHSESVDADMNTIHQYLLDASGPVPRTTLLEQIDLPPVTVRNGIGGLIDMDMISVDESGDEPQFSLAGYGGDDQ